MRDKDCETVDDLREWNGGVLLPLLELLNREDEYDKVLALPLIDDLGLFAGSTRHDCDMSCLWVKMN